MKINKDILLECICYICNYNFSDITDYQIHQDYIIATVVSDDNISEYYVGTKSVDITFDEYQHFIRSKKLSIINNKMN